MNGETSSEIAAEHRRQFFLCLKDLGYSYAQIADRFDVTRTRARQICEMARRKNEANRAAWVRNLLAVEKRLRRNKSGAD